jgi:hypothetical protein
MGAGLPLAGRRRDASTFPAEISLSAIDTGEGILVTAAIRDVTARLRVRDLERSSQGLESFIIWVGEIFTIKTPEMKRKEIVAAMYACFADGNEQEARNFFGDVARGGKEYDDNHPTTVLDAWFKRIKEEKDDKVKGGDFYQGTIYAWNAYREERTLKEIKTDQRKGMLKPHA